MGAPRPRERAAHQLRAARVQCDVPDLSREHIATADRRGRWHLGDATPDAEASTEVTEQSRETLSRGVRIRAREHEVWMIRHERRGEHVRKRRA